MAARRHVVISTLRPSAYRHQFPASLHELRRIREQRITQVDGTVDDGAIGELARGIDRG